MSESEDKQSHGIPNGNGAGSGGSANVNMNSTPATKTVAVEKERKPSKKFQIQSVDVAEDPLYKNDLQDGQNPKSTSVSSIEANGSKNNLNITDQADGRVTFLCSEEPGLRPRSSSNASYYDKFYSVEDLRKAKPAEESVFNGDSSPEENLLSSPPLSHSQMVATGEERQKAETNGSARSHGARYSKRTGDARLNFDDSFYKRAMVQQRLDSQDNPDPESVTDIFVNVPDVGPSQQSTIHETITSAYETSISINNLLKERHKPSLAAMGRLFGSRQKEMEAQKQSTNILPVQKKEKKKPCHCVKPIHVCLTFGFLVIVSSAIVTLALFSTVRKMEAANEGYEFDHKSRILLVYPGRDDTIRTTVDPIFKATLGVNIHPRSPNEFVCPPSGFDDDDHKSKCYRWRNTVNISMLIREYDTRNICIDVKWSTYLFEPKLKDCFDINGHWFGGFRGSELFPLGKTDISKSAYLPGTTFGDVVERLWFSTAGIAIGADGEFPLYFEANNSQICLSSWYGYQTGKRHLSYSICRGDNHRQARRLLTRRASPTNFKQVNLSNFCDPVYSYNSLSDLELLKRHVRENYSYIIDWSSNLLEVGDLPRNSSFDDQDRPGISFSPLVPLDGPVDPSELESDIWVKSTDLAVSRLFKISDNLSLIANSSSNSLAHKLKTTIDSISVNNNSVIVKVKESGIAHVTLIDTYAVDEVTSTFQLYNHKLISTLLNTTASTVMTRVSNGLSTTSVVVSLPPVSNLSATVTDIFQTSIAGYNIISPGVIGGDLDPALFIRAVQLAIFMPVMEFSSDIFKYNSSTLDLWKSWLRVRQEQKILVVLERYLKENPNEPLYAPVWWRDPGSEQFKITDQFIVANKYLLAPIVDLNSSNREVYFPKGIWVRRQFTASSYGLETDFVYDGNSRHLFTNVRLNDMLVFETNR